STIFVQYGSDLVTEEPRQIEQCVNFISCKTTTLDNVGIFDVGYAGSPADVDRGDALPAQHRHILHLRGGDLGFLKRFLGGDGLPSTRDHAVTQRSRRT